MIVKTFAILTAFVNVHGYDVPLVTRFENLNECLAAREYLIHKPKPTIFGESTYTNNFSCEELSYATNEE